MVKRKSPEDSRKKTGRKPEGKRLPDPGEFSFQPNKAPEKTPPAEELFPWVAACNKFLEEHDVDQIDSVEHPQIHIIDQYLKQVMEGLMTTQVPGMRDLVDVICDHSPLLALFLIAEDKLKAATFFAHGVPPPFLVVMMERLRDDLELKEQFKNGHGAGKTRAMALLRARGLMK
jgi:hypothetical protein